MNPETVKTRKNDGTYGHISLEGYTKACVIILILQIPIILAPSLCSVTLLFTVVDIIGFIINFLLVIIDQWQSVRTCHVMWVCIEARLACAKAHEDQFGIGEDAWNTSESNSPHSLNTHTTCCATTMLSSLRISSKPSSVMHGNNNNNIESWLIYKK